MSVLPEVGAGHREAEVEKHFGYAAHAYAADADEMDVLNLVKHLSCIPRITFISASST